MFKLNMDLAKLQKPAQQTWKSRPVKTEVLEIYLISCVIRPGRVNASIDNLMKSQ